MNGAGNKSVTHLVIGEDDPGQRLDNFLIRVCKGVPKSHVYRILRSGEVRVNGRRAAAGYRLCVGDVLRLPPLRIAERPEGEVDEAAKQRVDLPILYEDEAMLVIDKPDGIAVHGAAASVSASSRRSAGSAPTPGFSSWHTVSTAKPRASC